MELKLIAYKVIELAAEVGSFISNERSKFSMDKVENKGVNDFVSYVDKAAERKLVEGLSELLPEAGFIAEENSASNSNEDYLWVVDPLDGTTNFIHNLTPHAISIALLKNLKPVFGLVYEIGAKEAFYSWSGVPVFCNGTKVGVSKAKKLSESLVATGFHTNKFQYLPMQLKVVDKVVRNSHGLRRHGSAATDLAYVAAGRFDVFFEHGLNLWDVAAGAFLVIQAGGVVSDYSGKRNYMLGREIIAGTIGAQTELLNIIKTELSEL